MKKVSRHIVKEVIGNLLSTQLSGTKWKSYTPQQIQQMYDSSINQLKDEIYKNKPFHSTPFYALYLIIDSKLKKSTSTKESLEILSQYVF